MVCGKMEKSRRGMMEIYRVAVCDDEALDLGAMAALAGVLLREAGVEHTLSRFRSAAGLLDARGRGAAWDLILLDIMMQGQDGIALAEDLRRAGDETDLIFITSSPEYALAGYRAYPVSYLLKPLSREKLSPVLTRCLRRRQKLPCLVLEALQGGKYTIPLGDIRYLEVFRRELVVHCGDRTLSCAGPLSAVLDTLPEAGFYRCHRSFVVNLAHVSGIQKYRFLLRNGGEVPIAMRPYRQAQARWLAFLE